MIFVYTTLFIISLHYVDVLILNSIKLQYSRKNGRERKQFCSQVGQVNQQEDKQRLYDANLLGKTSDEGQNNSKDETHQSSSNTDNEEWYYDKR